MMLGPQMNGSSGLLDPAETLPQEEAPTVSVAPAIHQRGIPRNAILSTLIFLSLLVLLYWRIGTRLVRAWSEMPDYSHGFLIPLFVAYLVWDQRESLRRVPIKPTWAGLSVVLPALLMLVVGVFGANDYLARLSFVLLSAGLIWTLGGPGMLGRTKFMLAVLLLAIPLPTILFNRITLPLQLFASSIASTLLPLAGVPVLRDGNVIGLASMQLEVAEACSGIRSLLSLFTVALMMGYFLERSTWRRLLLALVSIPVAIVANVIRIFATGLCVQYWNPDKAEGFFHEFSGWLIFVVSLTCLYLVHRSMAAIWPDRRQTA